MSAVTEEQRPKIYDAGEVAYKSFPSLTPAKVTVDPMDPLRSFENDEKQITTDLKLWMTFSPQDRAQRLADLEIYFQNELAIALQISDPQEAIRIRELRWRSYAFIVWREAKPEMQGSDGKIAPRGSKEIATKATELLFTILQAKHRNPQAPK
jgi:hypothetical protein